MEYKDMLLQAEETLRETEELGERFGALAENDPVYKHTLESQRRNLETLKNVGDVEKMISDSDGRIRNLIEKGKKDFEKEREALMDKIIYDF